MQTKLTIILFIYAQSLKFTIDLTYQHLQYVLFGADLNGWQTSEQVHLQAPIPQVHNDGNFSIFEAYSPADVQVK